MSDGRSLVLLGGGGHAAVVGESAIAAGWLVAGYLDDGPSTAEAMERIGLVPLGSFDDLAEALERVGPGAVVHAAAGNSALRRSWLDRGRILGAAGAVVINPSAAVSPSASIDEGAFIGPRAVVNARAMVGRGAIVNSGAIIEHDCVLRPFCHVAPGAALAGDVTIGEDSLVGLASAVCPGVRIGARVTLGAGAVAVEDIGDGCVAVGVPAKVMCKAEAQGADPKSR